MNAVMNDREGMSEVGVNRLAM